MMGTTPTFIYQLLYLIHKVNMFSKRFIFNFTLWSAGGPTFPIWKILFSLLLIADHIWPYHIKLFWKHYVVVPRFLSSPWSLALDQISRYNFKVLFIFLCSLGYTNSSIVALARWNSIGLHNSYCLNIPTLSCLFFNPTGIIFCIHWLLYRKILNTIFRINKPNLSIWNTDAIQSS